MGSAGFVPLLITPVCELCLLLSPPCSSCDDDDDDLIEHPDLYSPEELHHFDSALLQPG